jgi:hypothetical protein
VAGINLPRRGTEPARDILHTDCRVPPGAAQG